MIEIKSISKTYDDQKVVDNLSLSVPRSTVFGFLGPNGAGKTTTVKIVVGINKPDSGSVSINGQSPTSPVARKEIGFMPEEPHFYDQLTGLEFIEFANKLFGDGGSPGKDLKDILGRVGIYDARNKKIRTYSKGMKQRLGFAQALVNNPKYIFLDEPLDGLDPVGRLEIKTILQNLKEEGKTIFFNSHILSDVESICDNIGIIHRGKLIYSGSISQFRNGLSLEEKFVETIKSHTR